jgi:hypothetical protein
MNEMVNSEKPHERVLPTSRQDYFSLNPIENMLYLLMNEFYGGGGLQPVIPFHKNDLRGKRAISNEIMICIAYRTYFGNLRVYKNREVRATRIRFVVFRRSVRALGGTGIDRRK